MKRAQTIAFLVIVVLVGGVYWFSERKSSDTTIDTFAECAAAGNAIQESFPEVCVTEDGERFVNPDQKVDPLQ